MMSVTAERNKLWGQEARGEDREGEVGYSS